MNPGELAVVLVALAAPLALLGLVGMVLGYEILLSVRKRKGRDDGE